MCALLRESIDPERRRLRQDANGTVDWRLWGPFLSERAWGTVREDYGHDGKSWRYFPHDHAPSRAYRWNEDGLLGFCNREQTLCFALALWNGRDPILKERLFGLSTHEGNHGEDVKELYWYLDATPTHSYVRMRYRYPQAAFPYKALRTESRRRGYSDPEYEITDTGVFDERRYFDVDITYAKASADDLLIDIAIRNRAAETASLELIPQLWFRNTWSWGYENGPRGDVPVMPSMQMSGSHSLRATHPVSGDYTLAWQGKPKALFTHNDSNRERLYRDTSRTPWTKDAFHRYVVNQQIDAINPAEEGTKAGLQYSLVLEAGEARHVQLRLSKDARQQPFRGFRPTLERRRVESDRFFAGLQSDGLDAEMASIQRQALSGMLLSGQIYYYDVRQWFHGDPVAPITRHVPRNIAWQHMESLDVLSMPDKWEYPWFAVWDTAFHCLPLALVDIEFAKRQLALMTEARFMHPNGQLPAYEWYFEDVNPPVHAWSALAVYRQQAQTPGAGVDRRFLEAQFHKLLMNFSWWVNNKSSRGDHLYEGGFLGLDNISLFDRSAPPPGGGVLSQADGTGWMGLFARCLFDMALELARENPTYEDLAIHAFEHYARIARAVNGSADTDGLWDERDGFFYDTLRTRDGQSRPIRLRSLVGLLPLAAVGLVDQSTIERLPGLSKRLALLEERHPDLARALTPPIGPTGHRLMSLIDTDRLRRVLGYLLDEAEFLSPHGIRSLSAIHRTPYTWQTARGKTLSIHYEPGDGETDLFGGNSNWRGPIWFPVNYLLIDALRRYHMALGDDFTVECPTGSGRWLNLDEVADELSRRLISLFQRRDDGAPPWCGEDAIMAGSVEEGLHQFHEFFDGDTGRGLGASHQTGWTGLVAVLIQQLAIR